MGEGDVYGGVSHFIETLVETLKLNAEPDVSSLVD